MNKKAITTVIPVAISMVGGTYFGLFSCGGYVWHKSLYNFVLVFTVIICFSILWKNADKSTSRGKSIVTFTIWIFLVWATYTTCEAAAASFYPDAPISFSDFWSRFLICLKNGPC